jgi:hypothetical protein
MPSTSRLLAVAVALTAVGAYGTLKSSADAGTGPAAIRITDRQYSYTRVDVGARGRSPGDQEIIYDRLYNRKITSKSIGSARFLCTFTTGITRMCTASVNLPKGELIATGTVRFRQFYDLAVVGGTGLYDNARGTLTIIRTTQPPRPIRELLYFRLTG